MPIDWNDEQKLAIKSRNGTVLVSAAAGSGKSAVLVERVIRRICDEEKKCSADRLMIVTFTNAAAAELRHKVNKELSKKIKENPNNEYLIRQQRLLSSAVIGTMDAFCGTLIRENFFLCDIDPDFRILDGTEEKLLKSKAVDSVLEKYYEEKPDAFLELLEIFDADKNDRSLIENINTCYEYSIAYDRPEKWIDSMLSEYDETVEVGKTESGKAILNVIRLRLEKAIDCLNEARPYVEGVDGLEEKLLHDIDELIECANRLKSVAENGEWDKFRNEAANTVVKSFPRVANEYQQLDEKKRAQELRTAAAKIIKGLKGVLPMSEEQYRSDCRQLRPALECFANIIKEFSVELLRLKKEENAYGFSDISHAALDLLIDKDGNRTPLALGLAERFEEILIDEYQDTNKAQDMLFYAISREGKNLFIVGDVKQSIYSFRKAMPEIFIDRRNSYELYDENKDNYPSKIFLDSNYRSRKTVIDTVNFVFSRLMNEKTGDIEYGNGERLNYEAKYDDRFVPCEIHHLRYDEEKNTVNEYEHIALQIEQLIDSKMQIKDGEIYRDIRYGDICVLYRKLKGNGVALSNVLKNHGIPYVCEANESFCNLYEVSIVLSLLKTVDNPLNDVALLTTLFSPIYGFTPDELAEIRLENGGKRLYSCLKKYAMHNQKAKSFLDSISEFRNYSVIYSASEMLRRIYEETRFDDIVRVMPDGDRRAANLMHLIEYAEYFEQNGNFGLSEFMRFVDKVTSAGGDISVKSDAGESGNCVKIMTVHKSKGLEFPVVIIGNCNRSSYQDYSNQTQVYLNSKTKLGFKRLDRSNLFTYLTVQFVGTDLQNRLDDVAEELRILYVAMTRAKEKLIFVLTDGGGKNSLSFDKIYNMDLLKEKIPPIDVIDAANYAKWILAVAFRASGCEQLRNESGFVFERGFVKDAPFLTYKSFLPGTAAEEQTDEQPEEIAVKADERFINELEERINFEYSYLPLTTVAAKRTASGFNEQEISDIYFASEKPAFMGKGNFTPAQRGTLTHLFMEKCDFEKAKENVDSELERLTEIGVFTHEQADAVNISSIKSFFESDLFDRMQNSSALYREQQFTVSIPAQFFESGLETDENVVVQGKIDCFFIEDSKAVIIDYKTDFIKTAEELTDRYLTQMKIYKQAVEQFTGKEVKEVLLYSFALEDAVRCI